MSRRCRAAATIAVITLAACAETKLGDGAHQDSTKAPPASAPAAISPMVCLPDTLTAKQIADSANQQDANNYFGTSGYSSHQTGWRIAPANNALASVDSTNPRGYGCQPGQGRIVAKVWFAGPGLGEQPFKNRKATDPLLDRDRRYYVWVSDSGSHGRVVSDRGVEVQDASGRPLPFVFEPHPNDGPHRAPKAQWRRPRNLMLSADTLDWDSLSDSTFAMLGPGTPWITCAAKGCCRIDIEVQ